MIVDASVATAWFVPLATSEQALKVRRFAGLRAPDLMRIELTSSLLKYVRAGLLDPGVLVRAQDEAEHLIDAWERDAELLPIATSIALEHNHKIYDCLYLALARRRGEPLATADRRLALLAGRLSIPTELIEPSL
jgi:predicted nucleic acid-binding protein